MRICARRSAEVRRALPRARASAPHALLAPLRVPLLVNDRIDVALAAGADGAHVGQADMPVVLVRKFLGAGAIIGLSITSSAEARGDDTAMADYLGVGPIFAQLTKPDAAPALGLGGLAEIRRISRKPIVAIGGVTAANARAVQAAGADGVAVVSAIMGAQDPTAAAAAFDLAD